MLRRRSAAVEQPAEGAAFWWVGSRWVSGFSGRAATALGCLVLISLTLTLHLFFVSEPTNDHMAYLAMAQQIVLGDVPIGDFRDDGSLLQIVLSAAVQRLWGHRLIGEMVLAWTFIAAGSCLTYVLATRLSGSRTAGFVAALLTVFFLPRPYGFPKMFVYVLAIAALWRYLDHPHRHSLILVAACAALALFFRIDHGVVVASVAMLVIVMRHVPDFRRAARLALGFAGLFFLFSAPLWVYVAATAGLPRYVRGILSFGEYANFNREPFPPRFSLDGSLITSENAVTLLFHIFLAIGLVGALYVIKNVASALLRSRAVDAQTLRVAAVVTMWIAMLPVLARGEYHARVADVSQPVAILGAWLAAAVVSRGPLGRPFRLATVLAVLTAAGLALLVREPGSLLITRGPGFVKDGPLAHAAQLVGALNRNAADAYAPSVIGPERGLVRYVSSCTERDDRLLVTWFGPEYYFLSGRAFAGDRWIYVEFDNDPRRQREVVEQIKRQSVPLAFVKTDQYEKFRQTWPAIAEYLDSAYVEAAEVPGPELTIRVLARKDRQPARRLEFASLPCFR